MRILDRYLLREYISACLLGLVGFVGIFLLVDAFEKLDVFVDHGASLPLIARYYGLASVTFLIQVLPIAMLLGTLFALSQLRKHNEIAAMQSAGQSPWRLALPLLLAALLVSIGQYALNEGLEPQIYEAQKRILNREIKRLAGEDMQSRADVRVLGANGCVYAAQFYDARRSVLRGVTVQKVQDARLLWRVDAESATWVGGAWRFERGFLRRFSEATVETLPFRTYGRSDVDEPPRQFGRQNPDPFHLGMKDLWEYMARLRENGGDTSRFETNFHIRASFPLANVIMTLLGAALSLRVLRGGSLAAGFGLSVSLGFAYFALIRLGQALGYSETLPPPLAAWLGNIIFSLFGVWLFWKVSR